MSPSKLRLVIGAAVAFMALTLFEVVTQREDWPLSPYPMYAELASKVAKRTVLVGVSDRGEFPLTDAQTSPYTGSRLLTVSQRLKRQPARLRDFIRLVGERYDSRRVAAHWPILQGIRAYSETWPVRPRLEGMAHPKRALASTVYVRPRALSERLRAEEQGTAPILPLLPAAGDRVVDLPAAACEAQCSTAADRYAAGSGALALSGSSEETASLAVEPELAAGRWFVFLRMKTGGHFASDRVTLELDGEPHADVLGNYHAELPSTAWVWASTAPGARPSSVQVTTSGRHRLRIESKGRVMVDQLWLSRQLGELPVDNQARSE